MTFCLWGITVFRTQDYCGHVLFPWICLWTQTFDSMLSSMAVLTAALTAALNGGELNAANFGNSFMVERRPSPNFVFLSVSEPSLKPGRRPTVPPSATWLSPLLLVGLNLGRICPSTSPKVFTTILLLRSNATFIFVEVPSWFVVSVVNVIS